jgi:hypothetical protein
MRPEGQRQPGRQHSRREHAHRCLCTRGSHPRFAASGPSRASLQVGACERVSAEERDCGHCHGAPRISSSVGATAATLPVPTHTKQRTPPAPGRAVSRQLRRWQACGACLWSCTPGKAAHPPAATQRQLVGPTCKRVPTCLDAVIHRGGYTRKHRRADDSGLHVHAQRQSAGRCRRAALVAWSASARGRPRARTTRDGRRGAGAGHVLLPSNSAAAASMAQRGSCRRCCVHAAGRGAPDAVVPIIPRRVAAS